MREALFERAYPRARRSARVRASAAVARGAIQSSDREDLEQEAVTACWRALAEFDPNRASLATYVECVVATRIASVCRAGRRLRAHQPLALASDRCADDMFDHFGLRIDIERLLSARTDDERHLTSLLMEHTPSEASRMLRVARSTIYARIQKLRPHFAAAGFGSADYAMNGSAAECRPDCDDREPAPFGPTTI
jgi:RNA polymerase sigma factor (sigma-70 family)